MKPVHLVIVLCLLAVLLPITAAAQGPGEVGVFFDAQGTVTGAPVTGFVPFQFYVLGFDLAGDVKGFEFEVTVPFEVTVLARNLGAGWLNVGSGDNFIVGTGGCLSGTGVFQFVLYDALILLPSVPSDLLICLGPSTPSSFVPATPGYLQCDNTLTPLSPTPPGNGIYPDGCGIVNPSQMGGFEIDVEITAGTETAQPGLTAEIPISLTSRLFVFPKTTPIPPEIHDLACIVSWDPAVASFENARLTDALVTMGWTMSATPAADSVMLSASGPAVQSDFDSFIDFFLLELRLAQDGGATVLDVTATSVNGGNTDSFGTPGAFSEDVVSTRNESFSQIKARFGG